MDTMSPQQRHKNMAAIRSADTKPEMTVRRWLHSRGFRYRLNHPRLPGHPDIVLRKYRPAGSCDFCGEVTADTVEYRGMHICAACRRAISQL